MAYDEELAERIRDLIEPGPTVAERKMFGGLSFLVGGNMALAVSGKGGLLVRVGSELGEQLIDDDAVQQAVMGSREMTGWVRVAATHVEDEARLREWVDRGVEFARSLPPKD
ncbi:TfoX/Sxy family protein [Nocardia cyriacigeorgica]|uniref:TfoX/Sxy family protein n=1 Tax=Nocardia cyriacigeorgica TaxID=135487 RepID=UPI0013D820D9|nr:TfoX/Sxy family protein [Nocardia cyriacigeorgica]MBF6436524.1 TfoX/Sxy family protein [Nocardia cyriacigeorgica]MBF6452093.1 TfoX/Sxy family protein [Nocardia cyriacigeorgica]MBF6478887.1 TfoX/Sxy family protein [Nocardia cyriacigeorgica]MBF6549262.1 TfoX/Sxy family protein [Nocardia cyriacigeorgica]NEW25321.1 TfoX/Sxy family protein [Nocardia cyriacigeorgica]